MRTLKIAQLTDLHVCLPGQLVYGKVDTNAYLLRAINRLNALHDTLDAVVISGDLVDHGTPEEYATLRPMLDQLSLPWWPVPGNHDGNAFWSVFSDRMPEAIPDVGYVIEHAGIRFILLDTRVAGYSHGELNDERMGWLSNALPSEVPTVLVMHHPPFTTGIAHMDKIGLKGSAHLHKLILSHPPLAVLCGHVHRTIMTTLAIVPVLIAPSPAHAVAFDLSDDGPLEFQMEPPAVLVHVIEGKTLVSLTVFIDTFDGPWPFFGE